MLYLLQCGSCEQILPFNQKDGNHLSGESVYWYILIARIAGFANILLSFLKKFIVLLLYKRAECNYLR